ncbi:MAG: NYN domain-containing protein [Candidatus Omnitrophica bacterium]|nr:NYN domain-containing protein [Candidatus Omnitrophota bacterium]
MVTLVVDAYNAIYAIPEIRALLKDNLKKARDKVTALSKEYARSSGYISHVKVVFDGDDRYAWLNKYSNSDGTQIFSGTDKGDRTIIEAVRICSSKGRVVLASNDNYVRNNARGYGATVINSEELIKTVTKKSIREKQDEKEYNNGVYKAITDMYRKKLFGEDKA